MATKFEYPEWLTIGLVHGYKAGVTVKEMAELLLYPEASIRWKLTREGVYESKTTKRKQLQEIKAEQHGF
jgi:hypothetical protein